MRRRFGAVVAGAVVEVFGAVAAEFIEEAVAPVVSAVRAAERPGDRWAAAWHEGRPEVPQYAVQWAAVPPWARPVVLQYGGRGEVVSLWVRAAARQFADQWAAALPWVLAGVRQYADQWVAAPR
jgi:hypothetical protein